MLYQRAERVGTPFASALFCQYEADAGPSPRGGKPFGLRTACELRVCKRFGVGATVNQNSTWKFQLDTDATLNQNKERGSQWLVVSLGYLLRRFLSAQ